MNELPFPLLSESDLERAPTAQQRFEYSPGGRADLEFSILVPKGWGFEPNLGKQQAGTGQLAQIALFGEKGGKPPAVVSVTLVNLPFEIRLEDWFRHKAAEQGLEIVRLEPAELRLGPGLDALALAGRDSRAQVARISVQSDGPRIFLVVGMAPRARYGSLARDLMIATHTFRLLKPTKTTQMEIWATIQGGTPPVRFAVPTSWEVRKAKGAPEGVHGFDVVLTTETEMLSFLRLKVRDPRTVGSRNARAAQEAARQELLEQGVALASPFAPDPDFDPERFDGLEALCAAKGRAGSTALIVRNAFLKRGDVEFEITQLVPAREASPGIWMRATRLLEIVLQTVEPGEVEERAH